MVGLVGLIFTFLFFVILGVVLQGLRKIPAEPPTKAVVTRLGQRTGGVKKEGWRFFLFYPFLNGYIPVNVEKKNFDFEPHDVRTPDMAEIEMKVHVTFSPDSSSGTQLIAYLNSGGEDGVKDILEDIIMESVREFAVNPDHEPKNWEMAVKMDKHFLAEIVASMLGIDHKNPENSQMMADVTRELRRGNGNMKLETLGIIIHRVNVVSIRPKGELAKNAEKVANEVKEREAEMIELEHIREQVKRMVAELGIKPEKALEIIQTERNKVIKTIEERNMNYTGLDGTGMLGAIADKFLNK